MKRKWKVGDLMKFKGTFSGTDFGIITKIERDICFVYWFNDQKCTRESLYIDPSIDDLCLSKIG